MNRAWRGKPRDCFQWTVASAAVRIQIHSGCISSAALATLMKVTASQVSVLHIQTHHRDNRCHENKELFLKPVQFFQMTHFEADS